MTSVGNLLRSARESQGLDITEIAEGLCIQSRYLRAIEDDDFKSLPGTFFYKSFLKQYAAALGVPEQHLQPGIESVVEAEHLPLPPTQAVASPIRQLDPIVQASNRDYFTDRKLGIPVAVLGAVILTCSGFYSWWNRPVEPRAPLQQAVNQHPETQPAVVSPATSATSEPLPLTTPALTEQTAGVVLSLSATERTWLSVSSAGKEVFAGILQPGETKTLTGLEAARMKVGNAGGIEIHWNGKPVGPIGASGQVKTIVFTPDNLEILEPSGDATL
ncbi:MAG: helix-turn-helix domain-containing protein [Bryobacterales bacterium]|nr:helix-turn-helix domain-containing protein [Bryobacterales bacterium]MBV9398745.1 helix-turn-helix domain-containing protein [Bryobacterales bacterium]